MVGPPVITPVEVAVGAGDPHGKAITSHEVAKVEFGFKGCVQANFTELYNTVAEGAFNNIGF